MKNGRFTEHRIVSALKKQEAVLSIKDLSRELGISAVTYYNWKANEVDTSLPIRRIIRVLNRIV